MILNNAKDTNLDQNPGTLTNVQDAIFDYFQPLVFARIAKDVVNFELVEVLEAVEFQGCRQPLFARELLIKPEGQREWNWERIHAFPTVTLEIDEVIFFDGIPYRVAEKYDYTEYGYLEYHMYQDYQDFDPETISALKPSTLPNPNGAMLDWFQKLTFTQVFKSVVNFELVESQISTSFLGVRQPFTPQQLAIKPEGQRQWKWETIHALPSLVLGVDDIIVFGNTPYRVIKKSDWKDYGYVEYQILQDYFLKNTNYIITQDGRIITTQDGDRLVTE